MQPSPDVDTLISQSAQAEGIQPELLHALIWQESNFDPNAVSSAGAAGWGQLMPMTAKRLGVADPKDPRQAIPAAAKYLREGIDAAGGDIRQGLMYYFGGPDKKLWGPKTQAYPDQVLRHISGSPAPAPMMATAAAPGDAFTNAAAALGSRPATVPVDHNPWLQQIEHNPFLSPVDHNPFQ